MSENNGHASSRLESIADLRAHAAEMGLRVNGKSRYELTTAIADKERRNYEATIVFDLRKECAAKGLATTGSREELELRLATNQDGAIQRRDRLAYQAVAVVTILLGLAALAISIPHIAAELSALMNCSLHVGYLLAVVIDGGIVGLKVVDTLGHKFSLSRSVRTSVWSLLITCLVFSAALNASQFLRHVEENLFLQGLSILLAVFIASFVFLMFMVGSNMLVHCEDKSKNHQAKKSAAELFREHADVFDKLQAVAKQL